MSPEPLWRPSAQTYRASALAAFVDTVQARTGRRLDDYDALWRWSVDEPVAFWSALWDHFGLAEVSGYQQVLASARMPGAQWFPGARLNFATQILAGGSPEAVALTSVAEPGELHDWTWRELRAQVAAMAGYLRSAGVRPGGRVVGYLPHIGETVVAFLATASLGAVWSGVGQEYHAEAVVHRFAQLEPTVLVASDGYRFGGRWHDRLEAVTQVAAGLPSVTRTVLVSTRAPAPGPWVHWEDAIGHPEPVSPIDVDFSHPLWILFSSGTTGLPKGLVHSHGGVLLQELKDLALHLDVHEHDTLLWHTSPSWVMWNIATSALLLGCRVVCYSGSPTYPGPERLWELVGSHDVTFFGTSPAYLQNTRSSGVDPRRSSPAALRAIGSTGSPLSPEIQQWAHDLLPEVPVLSMSGGTDIAGGFVGPAPSVPVWAGEISTRMLGVAAQVWDDDGHPVVDRPGELVVTAPLPSMPVALWDDPDGARYEGAYFTTYPGVWRQGDSATLTARGSVVIHGRSDATLNRNGIRMGTADIYAAVDDIPEIADCLVVGVELADGDYWLPMFVALREGVELDAPLVEHVRRRIRDLVSPRHVPDDVLAVAGLPRTRTGKRLEVPVKRILQGVPIEQAVNADVVDDSALLLQFVGLTRSASRDRRR